MGQCTIDLDEKVQELVGLENERKELVEQRQSALKGNRSSEAD